MADTNIEIMFKDVRISYAWLFDPQERRDDKTKEIVGYNYSVNVLLDKKQNKDLIDKTRAAMKAAKAAKWPGDKAPMIPPERLCMRDGEPIDPDTVDPDVPGSGERKPISDGYAGMMFVSANKGVKNKDDPNPVQLIDSRKGPNGKFPRLRKADGKLYSGCYANVLVRIYAYDGSKNNNPNRINASLEAVQFVRHGEAFGAKPVDVESVFDDLGGEDGFDETSAKAAVADDDLGI
jgi:hypothetical protein